MKMSSRIYLVFAILTGIIGIAQCIRWYTFEIAIWGYLLCFLPAITFSRAYVKSQQNTKKTFHVAAISLCLMMIFIWGYFTLGVEMVHSATTEVTDIQRYEEILNDYWHPIPNLTDHFPQPIPSIASDIKFAFLPAFLQGGAYIQLRYTLPPDAISKLHDHFSNLQTKTFFGGDTNEHMNVENGMPTTLFYTSGSDNHTFPDDFEIMVLDELPKENNPLWNHGQCHGVAISKTQNQIVYWAESW